MSVFTVTFVAKKRPWLVLVEELPEPELLGFTETTSNEGLAAGACEKTGIATTPITAIENKSVMRRTIFRLFD